MDLLSLNDYEGDWIKSVIGDAVSIKENPGKYRKSLEGRILSMLFMKPSTRTRTSFEAGMTQLGGHAINLDWRATNFAKGTLRDEIACIDRYSDIIMARVFNHSEILEIAKAAGKPVINGLCNMYHPCQALADLMTAYERMGSYDFTLAYVGDGNNVVNSLIIACSKVGAKIRVATPRGYEPDEGVVGFGLKHGLKIFNEPLKATENADIVYTDTWVSMGDEKERDERIKAFEGYTVDDELLGDAFFMHCLPAIRGQEVEDSVMDSGKSIIFDQAENRMHAQKAVMLKLLEVNV
jgi:ornithine carbamoyltransferase